jgi:hypothetical protein
MKEGGGESSPAWLRPLTGWPAAVVLLGAFTLLATTSAMRKSATFDEVAHLTAGYTYWAYNDYRLHPENGNLPQRLVALPAVLGPYRFPALDQGAWQRSEVYEMGHQFLFTLGNDVDGMVLRGRLVVILLSAGLGAAVYAIGRRLYGPVGATVSLAAYSFDPNMLAHARLMTSDLTVAVFFLLSVWAIWALLQRVTPLRLLASCLATAALLLSKMSGVLILPMGAALVVLRLARGGPWPLRIGRWSGDLSSRTGQVAVAVAAALAHVLAAWLLLWTFYGFHYDTFHAHRTEHDRLEAGTANLLGSEGTMGALVQLAQDREWLPEAYLYGFSFAVDQSQRRPAFLNGRRSEKGWAWFFPYAFAVKTSEGLMLLLLLAGSAALAGRRLGEGLYRTAPLWVLLAVYWWFALGSQLNIGHRHLLPTYPALFLLAGAAGAWLLGPGRLLRWATGVSLGLVLATALWIWPDYLAYFNAASGGPSRGYRRLVDSSLDWGQDLPALRNWLEQHGHARGGQEPVYLSYFGTSSPDHHGIRAWRLPGFFDLGRRRALVPLRDGIYCISASMLQLYSAPGATGWNAEAEAMYRSYLARIDLPDPAAARPLPYTDAEMERFDRLRLARLCHYLRHRTPDAQVGHSILIYRLSRDEVEEALYGSFA